jgi:hypothetical protein
VFSLKIEKMLSLLSPGQVLIEHASAYVSPTENESTFLFCFVCAISCAFGFKVCQRCQYELNIFVAKIFNLGIKKHKNADFKSVEKVAKKFQEKV